MQVKRLQTVDISRGIAILAMVAYHATWDLNYYGFIAVGIGVDALWFAIQRAILTAFLLLTGAGLWLGHGHGINLRRFWRRELVLVVAALGVSAVTWFQFGAYFAYFGVLHAIALSALLALPLVRAPLWLQLGVAIGFLFVPAVFTSPLFNTPWLAWIGFFTSVPETADLVPMFPWFGVVMLGLIGMRLLESAPAIAWRSETRPARALARLGRWSLIIYLVHQPLLFAVITPIAEWSNSAQQAKFAGFLDQCHKGCALTGDDKFCTAYCSCALDVTVRDDLWGAKPEDLGGLVSLCTEMAR